MGSPDLINKPTSSMFSIIIIIIILLLCCPVEGGQIGINWGRQMQHRLIPSMVVDMLLQNDIRHLKLFSPSENVLRAFASSGISITMTLPNEALSNIRYPGMAQYWLQEKVRRFQNLNVNISCLIVGSEPFSTYARTETYYEQAVVALRLIQQAIPANGYGNLIATVAHFTDVLDPTATKPSEADFRPDIRVRMLEVVRLLNRTNAPFLMNMFPIYSLLNHSDWDDEFAYMDNRSNFTVVDKGGLVYRNVFEFVYDSFLHALAKAGAPGMKLKVGKIGWPTDGWPSANIPNAERFFREFLPYIRSDRGTPLRPGLSIDADIHTLMDENKNKIVIAAFQRHWGVYWSNGQPKYKIDFTGRGRDIYPTTAKGVILMPQRWCVYNNNTSNMSLVKEWFDKACEEADCTTLSPGGSCSHLDYNMNVSYAFNQYYQFFGQSIQAGFNCDYDGLSVLVPKDPSYGTCKFPIEMLSAETRLDN